MHYITIKGTVGKTQVDLEVHIPVETILKETPSMMKAVQKYLPTIVAAAEALAEAAQKLKR